MKTIKLKKRNVAKLSDGQMESLQGGATNACVPFTETCGGSAQCVSDLCPTGDTACIKPSINACGTNDCYKSVVVCEFTQHCSDISPAD